MKRDILTLIRSVVEDFDEQIKVNNLGFPFFEYIPLPPGTDAVFPLDFYTPIDQDTPDLNAFVILRESMCPNRCTEGNEIHVPTYKLANAISWKLGTSIIKIREAIELFIENLREKIRKDQVAVLMSAGTRMDNEIRKPVGDFHSMIRDIAQKSLRGKMTHLIVSKQVMAALKDSENDQYDFILGETIGDVETERTVVVSPFLNETFEKIGGAKTKKELIIGINSLYAEELVCPVREQSNVFDDPVLATYHKEGFYGWLEFGIAALSDRKVSVGVLPKPEKIYDND